VTLCFMGLGMMDHNCHGQQLFIEWIHQPRSSSVLMGMLMDFKAFVVSICGFVNFPWPSWPIHFCIGCFSIRKKWKKIGSDLSPLFADSWWGQMCIIF
jgi:hypothetical protein